MNFDATLQRYLDAIPECDAILLMGMDGLTVAGVSRNAESGQTIEVFAAEYTNIMNRLNESLRHLNASDVIEHLHIMDNVYLLTRFINPQYYLLMAVRGAALLGFARFQLRRLALELSDAITSL